MQTHHTITHTHTHANTSHYHTQFKNCILVLLLGLRVHGLDLLNDDLWQPERRNIQTSNNTSITQHPQTCQMDFFWTFFGNSSMAISAQMSLKTFLNESWKARISFWSLTFLNASKEISVLTLLPDCMRFLGIPQSSLPSFSFL